jgi:hypothetical protein
MTIEQRMDQLEKRNKRLTVALTMTVVAMAAVVTMAATGEKDGNFDTVTARTIFVKNAEIQRRAEIGVVTARYINLKNKTGDYVVRLRANPAGDGEISTHSAKGNDLVVLSATTGGNGIVTTYQPNRKRLVELGATTGDNGRVTTYQPNGQPLLDLSGTENGGGIEVYNKTGEGIAQMVADEYGDGLVGAYDRKGKGRTLTPGP